MRGIVLPGTPYTPIIGLDSKSRSSNHGIRRSRAASTQCASESTAVGQGEIRQSEEQGTTSINPQPHALSLRAVKSPERSALEEFLEHRWKRCSSPQLQLAARLDMVIVKRQLCLHDSKSATGHCAAELHSSRCLYRESLQQENARHAPRSCCFRACSRLRRKSGALSLHRSKIHRLNRHLESCPALCISTPSLDASHSLNGLCRNLPFMASVSEHGLRLKSALSTQYAAANGYGFSHTPDTFSRVCYAGHQCGCHHCRGRTGCACSQLGSCTAAGAPCRACTGQRAEQQRSEEALHAQAQVAAGGHCSGCGRRYRRGELWLGPREKNLRVLGCVEL